MNGDSNPVPGLVRRARQLAGISQRQLARQAGVAPSTVVRVEAGTLVPTLPTFASMLAQAGLSLAVVDDQGRVVMPDDCELRDSAGRRYPAHLELIVDPLPGQWWGDRYEGGDPPAVIYHLKPEAEPGTRHTLYDFPVGFRRRRKRPRG